MIRRLGPPTRQSRYPKKVGSSGISVGQDGSLIGVELLLGLRLSAFGYGARLPLPAMATGSGFRPAAAGR